MRPSISHRRPTSATLYEAEPMQIDLIAPTGRPRPKGVYVLPSLFTTASLFAGFYAIVQAMNGNFDQAPLAIYIAMLLDALDGRVARLTHTESEFGFHYDSL